MNRRDLKKILSITVEDEVSKQKEDLEFKFAEIADRLKALMDTK